MKPGIHPEYGPCLVTCACGNSFLTRSTAARISLEICSACHPFFTGQAKLVDTMGRVERFQKRYGAGVTKTVRRRPTPARAKKTASSRRRSR